jgi:sortase B
MNTDEIMQERLNDEYRTWRKINIWIDRILLSILAFLILFIGSGLIDGIRFLGEGRNTVKYHSFSQLMDINPDTVAWITLDGTHIDHPVVRSCDNFDYLDKGFDGRYYAGGTLFLDKGNVSFEEPYCIIHGHNMAAGAMFGDLERYLDESFLMKNRTGRLLTKEYDYDIEVFAAGVFDAYDRNIYRPGVDISPGYLEENAAVMSDDGISEHVIALSTCFDDMTDKRTVVFCTMNNKRKHR